MRAGCSLTLKGASDCSCVSLKFDRSCVFSEVWMYLCFQFNEMWFWNLKWSMKNSKGSKEKSMSCIATRVHVIRAANGISCDGLSSTANHFYINVLASVSFIDLWSSWGHVALTIYQHCPVLREYILVGMIPYRYICLFKTSLICGTNGFRHLVICLDLTSRSFGCTMTVFMSGSEQ